MLTGIVTILIFYAALCLYLYLNQRNMMYFPVAPTAFHGLQAVRLQAGGEQLNAWMQNPGNSKAVLYFGGNAEAVAYNAGLFRDMLQGFTFYYTEYRGYGNSGGRPSEKALYADALAWYDLLARQHQEVVVIGRSLGSGVATWLASRRRVARMVLISPFDSATRLAAHHYPLFPVSILLEDKYDSVARSQHLTMPVLVIAGERDRIIPMSRTRALVNVLPSKSVKTVILKNVGHNDLSTDPAYVRSIARFLAEKNGA